MSGVLKFVRSLPEMYNAFYEKAYKEESKQCDKDLSVLNALAQGKSWSSAIDKLNDEHSIALKDLHNLRLACTPLAPVFGLENIQAKPDKIEKELVRINEKLKDLSAHNAAQIQRALTWALRGAVSLKTRKHLLLSKNSRFMPPMRSGNEKQVEFDLAHRLFDYLSLRETMWKEATNRIYESPSIHSMLFENKKQVSCDLGDCRVDYLTVGRETWEEAALLFRRGRSTIIEENAKQASLVFLSSIASGLQLDLDPTEINRILEKEKDRRSAESFSQQEKALLLEGFHDFLTGIGLIEPTGAVDVLNGVIYLAEGKKGEALMCFGAAAIPYVGDAIFKGGGKVLSKIPGVRKATKALENFWGLKPTKQGTKAAEKTGAKTASEALEKTTVDAFGGKVYDDAALTRVSKQIQKQSNGTIVLERNTVFCRENNCQACFSSPEQLKRLNTDIPNYLESHGLAEYARTGQGVIVVGEKPTYAKVIHEQFHMQHWMEVGGETFSNLSKLEKEKYVFERMVDPNLGVWSSLTRAEQKDEIAIFKDKILEAPNLRAQEKMALIQRLIDPATLRLAE